MAIYHAPKPSYTAWQWAKSVGARVLFPPVLLWDFSKWAVNKLAGKAVGHLVLPAQHNDFSWESSEVVQLKDNNPAMLHEAHTIITHDGAELDTLQITPRTLESTADRNKKYIINFVGNGMAFEQIAHDMQADATALNRVVIGFNLRGVSASTGQATSKDDLITDGIAQVQRLLDAGVPPQNITLKAHSLGGGIATLVAYHFHQHQQPVNLFNCRSFSSLTNFVVGQIRTAGSYTGHLESFGMNCLAG